MIPIIIVMYDIKILFKKKTINMMITVQKNGNNKVVLFSRINSIYKFCFNFAKKINGRHALIKKEKIDTIE